MKSLRTKSLWLLIFACVLGFTNIESSNNKNKKPVKSAKTTKQAAKPAKHVKHNKKEVKNLEVQSAPEVLGAADDHNIQVDEQPVQRGQKIMDPVIDSKIEQLKNGEVVQTVTTKQVVGNKVVTKTESWTWYDYAKAAALVAGVAAVAAVGVDYFANDSKGMNYVGGQAREGYDYSKQGLQSFGERLNEGYAYGKSKLNDARTSISNRWYGVPADNSSIVADADQVVPAEEVSSQDMSSDEAIVGSADQSASSAEDMAPESTEEAMSADENGGNLITNNPKTSVAIGVGALAAASATSAGKKALNNARRYVAPTAREKAENALIAAENNLKYSSIMKDGNRDAIMKTVHDAEDTLNRAISAEQLAAQQRQQFASKTPFSENSYRYSNSKKTPSQYATRMPLTEGSSGAGLATEQAYAQARMEALKSRPLGIDRGAELSQAQRNYAAATSTRRASAQPTRNEYSNALADLE